MRISEFWSVAVASVFAVTLAHHRAVLADTSDDRLSAHIEFYRSNNGEFPDARNSSDTDAYGIAFGLKWYPKTFKYVSPFFGAELGMSQKPGAFDEYLYTIERPIFDSDIAFNRCFYDNGDFRYGRCSPCSYSFSGYCELEDVYGADEYVKYVDGNIGLQAGVAFSLWKKRLQIEPGATASAVHVAEGIQTDDFEGTWKIGVIPTLNIEVGISRDGCRHAVVLSGQKGKIDGIDYDRVSAGYAFRFGRGCW